MTEGQIATCPECHRTISPEDTIVYRVGVLGHLDCRRPRVLSAEEQALLLIYCLDHPVAQCVRCAGTRFPLREVASINQFGVRTLGCPWCYTDLTDSVRSHLYDCAMLPAGIRRRAQAAREAARNLVKQSHQLSDRADVLVREAEAALHALRATMRQYPPSPARMARPRILLVGGTPPVAAMLAEDMHLDGGYEVESVAYCDDALAVLQHRRVDLVLVLSLHVPWTIWPSAYSPEWRIELANAILFLKHMRALHSPPPIILVSGSLLEEAGEEALANGAFAFIRKPVDLAELDQFVRLALESRKGNRSEGITRK